MHPRRWSGDTHDDLGGSIREAETDALMAEAAELIDTLRAQLEAEEACNRGLVRLNDASQARAEAAEADAARYRWLREEAARFKAHDPRVELVVSVTRLQRRTDNTGFTGLAVTPVGPEFDAAIDAARTKEQQA